MKKQTCKQKGKFYVVALQLMPTKRKKSTIKQDKKAYYDKLPKTIIYIKFEIYNKWPIEPKLESW